MKLYAICLVKNEDDIIDQTLTFATQYCDKIIVIDNGSTDRTWENVQLLAEEYPQIVPLVQTHERFDDGLRWLAYDAYHHELTNSDWWMILDGDEFLAEDPRPIIQQVMKEHAKIIMTWQIQFYFTEKDLEAWEAGQDSRDLPICARRRYYRIDWSEPRFFRNQVGGTWKTSFLSRQLPTPPWLRTTTSSNKRTRESLPSRKGKISRRRILNRHYQYRDPIQMEKRLTLRCGHPSFATQAASVDWRSKLRFARDLDYCEEGKSWRFSISGLAYYYKGKVRYAAISRFVHAREWLATLFSSKCFETSSKDR